MPSVRQIEFSRNLVSYSGGSAIWLPKVSTEPNAGFVDNSNGEAAPGAAHIQDAAITFLKEYFQ